MLLGKKKTIRAQEFVLEDAEGRELGTLRQDSAGGAHLRFLGPDGEPRLLLGVTPKGVTHVLLTCGDGERSIEIEANDALKSAGLIVTGAEGKVHILMGVTGDGVPAFALLDACEKPIFSRVDGHSVAEAASGAAPVSKTFDWDSLLDK